MPAFIDRTMMWIRELAHRWRLCNHLGRNVQSIALSPDGPGHLEPPRRKGGGNRISLGRGDT